MSLIASAESAACVARGQCPEDTLPGVIFTSVVILLMILFLVRVWYTNYGPGAEGNPNAAKFQD